MQENKLLLSLLVRADYQHCLAFIRKKRMGQMGEEVREEKKVKGSKGEKELRRKKLAARKSKDTRNW